MGDRILDIIEWEFRNRAVIQGKTFMYSDNVALEVVQRCRQLNKKIFGIDVFILTSNTTQIDDYIDYSSKYYELFDESQYVERMHIKKNKDIGHWAEAVQYIKDRSGKGYYFEIVYEDSLHKKEE